MGIVCACGRCAHRFEIATSEGNEAGAVRCPACDFDLCYRVAAGPADGGATHTDENADRTRGERQRQISVATSHALDVALSATTRTTQADVTVARPSAWKRASHPGVKIAVACTLAFILVGGWILSGSRPETPEQPPVVTTEPSVAKQLDAANEVTSTTIPESTVEADNLAATDNLAAAGSPEIKTARSLEEAKNAIVKFVIPLGIGNLTQHGTGFLIDDRGWVVTNNHVLARATTDARIKLADGRLVEIEGIVARSAERDLAIVQLDETPAELTLLDLGYDGQIPLGHEVFAFGHPYDAEFSLSKGIVSRNLTTADWLSNAPSQLMTKFRFPSDMIWIQHDAKISPGNSGGPLMDAQARVFGLNTFVHAKAEFGYASHVEYLRDVLESASGEIELLPAPRDAARTTVSTEKIRELSRQAEELAWRPGTVEEYSVLAELAKQMTIAKHASLEHDQTNGQHVTQRVASVADEQFAILKGRAWTPEQINSIREFALPALTDLGGGFVAPCSFIADLESQQSWVVRVDGTAEILLLRGGKRFAPAPRNTKCMVLGFVLPQLVNVKIQQQGRTIQRQSPVVLLGYVIPFAQPQ